MNRNMKYIIAVLLAFAVCFGMCAAIAEDADLPPAAAERTSGLWHYAVQQDGYAVITRYNGGELFVSVPAQIDGIDVVGIGAQVFSQSSSREVIFTSAVSAIAEDAFGDARPVIVAPNGSYALKWAKSHGCEWRNSSAYEFCEDVFDFSDAAAGAIVRHDYTEVEMKASLAKQLDAGDHFRMLDNNGIDFFFRVESSTDCGNGWYRLEVEVPAIADVVINMNTTKSVILDANGSHAVSADDEFVARGNYSTVTLDESDPITYNLADLQLKYLTGTHSAVAQALSGNVSFTVRESYTSSIENGDYEYLEMTEMVSGTINLSLNLGGSGNLFDDNSVEEVLKDPLSVEFSLFGVPIPVLQAGFFTIEVEPSLSLTLNGSATVTYQFFIQQTRVYNFDLNKWETVDGLTEVHPDSKSFGIKTSLELTASLGIKLNVNVFTFTACSISLEAGLKAEAGTTVVSLTDSSLLAGEPCVSVEIYGFASIKAAIGFATVFSKEFNTKDDLKPPIAFVFHISTAEPHVHKAENCPVTGLVKISFDTHTDKLYNPVYTKPGTTLSTKFENKPAPTNTSGAFLGWADNPNTRTPNIIFGDDGTGTVFDKSVTLYAVWENAVEVQFETGVDDLVVPAQYVPVGGYVSDPGTPEEPGNLFRYWYTVVDGEAARWFFNSSRVPLGGVTLVAGWYGENNQYLGGSTATSYIGVQFQLNTANWPSGKYTFTSHLMPNSNIPLSVTLHKLVSDESNILVPQTYPVEYYDSSINETIVLSVPVVEISTGAFSDCKNLRRVVFAYNGTVDLTNMFSNCPNLQYVDLSRAALKNGEIGRNAFSGCTNLQGVKVGRGLMKIDSYAFYQCRLQCRFSLPEGITGIGPYAFANTFIAGIDLPKGIVKVCESTFENAKNLYSVTLPEGVTTIERNAFNGCKNLTFARGDSRVQIFGDRAFYGCNLKDITDLIRYAVTIGYYTFADNPFSEIILPDTLTKCSDDAFRGVPVEYLRWTGGIPVVPNGMFDNYYSNCSVLKTVVLPEGVTALADSDSNYIFTKGVFKNSPLESITFPSTLTYIGGNCFEGCTNLSTIVLPTKWENVKVGRSAFEGCAIPDATDLLAGIVELGQHAFENNPFTEIILPDTLTKCPVDAFRGVPVEYLRWTAGIPTVPNGMFDKKYTQCTTLKTVVLPEGVTALENANYNYSNTPGVFRDSPLESVSLPSTLTYIGSSCFDGCTELKQVNYAGSPSVRNVMLNIRTGNEALTSLEWNYALKNELLLPSALTVISEDAFMGLPAQVIIVPEATVSIDSGAFASCSNLQSLILLCDQVSLADDALVNCSDVTVFCCKDSDGEAWCVSNDVPYITFAR